MKNVLFPVIMVMALSACDSGGSGKQGPQTQRQDTPASTAGAQCERMEGSARDECERQAREGGTATPSIGATGGTSAGATASGGASAGASASGSAARAERGSGVEGSTSSGTTSGNQQPLSTGGTTR